ncbi:N-acetylmuramic acid 6-phosphate etherase 2 [Paenibacillus sp. J2TS4]|nr:N-acetylmuramic acid 6-phosphate etherase 2 [Paenibacillus sp. J2TS4]
MRDQLKELATEQPNKRTEQIDTLPTERILELINEEDQQVAIVVKGCLSAIASAVEMVTAAIAGGGRLIYVGAGSSGRIAQQDALECPPTYGTAPGIVQCILAGGNSINHSPDEKAEDDFAAGAEEISQRKVTAQDVVVGIAASGRTPFVLGAMKQAAALGAKVIGICNNRGTPMAEAADLVIEAVTGPEAIMGSTRMKAGTAQKMILNMLTTATMIRLGKVYKNLMVDLQADNSKLVDRAKRIVEIATNVSVKEVERAYAAAKGDVKTAIVILAAGVDSSEARRKLAEHDGHIRKAMNGGIEVG